MRILFLAHSHVSFAAGGAQQVADDMLRAARARGHQVAMIAAAESKASAPLAAAPGNRDLTVFSPALYDDDIISCGDWRAIEALREHIRQFRPDVIYFHHYLRLGVEALVAARFAAPAATISLTLHEMAAICSANGQMVKARSREICAGATPEACADCVPKQGPDYYALRAERIREAFAYCDHFVFPSQSLARYYVEWGLPPNKCAVIDNGLLPLATRSTYPSPSAELNRFAYFGQLIDNKGLDVALRALLQLAGSHRIPSCGLEFQVHGANRHYATLAHLETLTDLARQIETAGGGRIRVVDRGEYTRSELPARMAGADWIIAPSVWPEAFGLVVSEAWMFGRPVIATAIGALGERIRPGVDGLTFPLRDHAALADHIAAVAGDAAAWRRLSSGIRPQPSADQMVEAYEQLWRRG